MRDLVTLMMPLLLLWASGGVVAAEEWPQNCYSMENATSADAGYRDAENKWRRDHPNLDRVWHRPEIFTMIFHADTQTFERRVNHTYPGTLVRLCITDFDYRLRYHIDSLASTALAPIPSGSGSAPASAPPTDASPLPEAAVMSELMKSAQTASPKPAPAGTARSITAIAADTRTSESAVTALQQALKLVTSAVERVKSSADEPPAQLESRDQLAHAIDGLGAEMTGEVPIGVGRAQQIRARLEDALTKLDAIDQQATKTARNRQARIKKLETIHAWIQQLSKLSGGLSASTGTLRHQVETAKSNVAASKADEVKALGESASDVESVAKRASDVTAELATQAATVDGLLSTERAAAKTAAAAKVDGEAAQPPAPVVDGAAAPPPPATGSSNADPLSRVRAAARAMLDHIAAVEHNVFYIPVEQDRELTLTLKAAKLSLSLEVTAAPLPAAALVAAGAAVAAATPGTNATANAHYNELASGEKSVTFQVRSLTWLRLNIGFAFTSLRNPGYKLGYNDVGAQVITHGDDNGIVPLFVLSHYWCGADLREIQPYSRFRRCGWMNTFLPTLAMGIPLSRDPTKNLFVGGMLQPVPGLALIGGLHVGEVSVLRHGYVDGQPPPLVQGQAFDVSQAQETVARAGYFIGVVVTDSVFVTVIAKLTGVHLN